MNRELITDLERLSYADLSKIARTFQVQGTSKTDLIQNIYMRYCDVKKYIGYTFVKQLGMEGIDGRTFLATDKDGNEVAVKIFKKTKKSSSIEREVKMQTIASEAGISPKILEYNSDGKYIVMEKLNVNLFDCFKEQKGQLTSSQQRAVLRLFKKLDECGVFHGDPNPLNFMRKDSKWYIIDFGFSKPINHRTIAKYGNTPNMTYMPLGFSLKLRKVFEGCKLKIIEECIGSKNISCSTTRN